MNLRRSRFRVELTLSCQDRAQLRRVMRVLGERKQPFSKTRGRLCTDCHLLRISLRLSIDEHDVAKSSMLSMKTKLLTRRIKDHQQRKDHRLSRIPPIQPILKPMSPLSLVPLYLQRRPRSVQCTIYHLLNLPPPHSTRQRSPTRTAQMSYCKSYRLPADLVPCMRRRQIASNQEEHHQDPKRIKDLQSQT